MRFRRARNGIRCVPAVLGFLIIGGIFMAGCSSSSDTNGDCFTTEKVNQRRLPIVETYIMNVESKDGSRIDVYTQLPFSRLQFEKDEDLFTASYTISYIFWDEYGSVVQTKDIQRKVTAGSYKESRSQRCDFSLEKFVLSPGNCTLELIVVDDASKLTYRHKQKVVAYDFAQGTFSASSFLFLEGAETDSHGQISLHPLLPSGVSLVSDSVGIFQEVYRVQPLDSLLLSFSYSVPIPRADFERTYSNTYPPDRFGYYASESLGDSIYYRKDSLLVSHTRGTIQVLQFFPRPTQGLTTITRSIILTRGGQKDTVSRMEKFPVHNPTFPRVTSRHDLILAVGLIGWGYEMDSLRAASSEMQETALSDFWAKHGGVPRRAEFERRLEEADELFSTSADGWETPMGITYVVCGPPDNVECGGRLTETWYYNIGNRTFAIPFRQMSDNKDLPYYEMVPNSVDESLWAYFVNSWRRQ